MDGRSRRRSGGDIAVAADYRGRLAVERARHALAERRGLPSADHRTELDRMSYSGRSPATPSNTGALSALRRPGAELRRQFGVCRFVFTSPDLRAAQVPLAVSKTVDLAQLIGLSTYLFDIEGVGAVATYGVVRAIAPTVGVPLVTATTSRLGPGALLMWLGIMAAIATAGITTAVALQGPVLTVIVLAGILHVILGAHRPVTSALMPTLVGTPTDLLACTAVAGLLDGVTFLAGPLLAGLLLVSAGPAAVLYATAVLHAVGALMSARLVGSAGRGPVPAINRRVSTARAVTGTVEVRVITLLVAAQTFVRGALNVIVVVFAIEVVGLDGSAAGLLLAAIGVGALVGMPIAYALTGRRLYRALGLGLLLWGMPVAIASVTPSFIVVLLLFAVIGLGNDLVDLGAFSALPRVLPGRVTAPGARHFRSRSAARYGARSRRSRTTARRRRGPRRPPRHRIGAASRGVARRAASPLVRHPP